MLNSKYINLLLIPVLVLLCGASGCDVGDVASSSSNSSVDNSVDNSLHGISSCSVGSTFVCGETGPDQFVQTEECMSGNGETVVLNGPDPIDGSLVEACTQPETAEVAIVEADGSSTDAEFPSFPTGTNIPTIPQ